MAQIYLINQATFALYEDISANVKPARMQLFVKKAQELDLKPFLGAPLYFDFLQYIDPVTNSPKTGTPQNYIDLLQGKTYTDLRGHTIVYDGLVPALVYWTFARFIEADAVRYTASGPAYKNHDQGAPLTVSDTVKLVQQQRSVANAHANEIEKFLIDNRKDYPLWFYNEKNKSSRQSGPRIRGIDRTDFNSPSGYNQDGYDSLGLNEFIR